VTVDAPARPGSRVFRGWWVVTGVFVMLGVTSGIVFYGLPVFLRALSVEKGFSISAVSGATAVFFLVSGVCGLGVASFMTTRDARPMIAVGAIATALSLLALGHVQEVWQVYAVYAVMGAGFAASSLVPGTTLVARWFSRRRSVALSIASTGLSAGGVVLTPFMAAMIREHEMPTVMPYLAAGLVLGVVPVTALLLRPSPEAMGLQPDGDPAPPAGSPVGALGMLVGEAVRTRFFVCVTLAQLLAMLAQVGGMAHLFNLVADRVDGTTAGTALSLLAVSSLVGRLAGGWVAARTSMRGLALVLMLAQACSLLLLAYADGRAALLATSVAFGLTIGNLLMLHPLLLAEHFGVRDYGHIYSRSQLVVTLGVAIGPAFMGVLRDAVDGYGLAFAMAAVASVIAAAVLALTGPTRLPDLAGQPDPVSGSRA
jgi:MFS family permease